MKTKAAKNKTRGAVFHMVWVESPT